MKRVGNIYEQVCSYENVRNAAIEAMRHKKLTRQMKSFAANFEANCHKLANDLKTLSLPACIYSEKLYTNQKKGISLLPLFTGVWCTKPWFCK